MTRGLTVAALAVLVVSSACGGSDEAAGDSLVAGTEATSSDPTSSAPAGSEPSGRNAFCDEYTELGGERPESYVGSPEHLANIEGLLALAPDAVSGDLTVFRDFVSSGAIDSDADPASNETANWPDDVQSAVANVQAFGMQNC